MSRTLYASAHNLDWKWPLHSSPSSPQLPHYFPESQFHFGKSRPLALMVANKPLKHQQNVAGAEIFVLVLRERNHISGAWSIVGWFFFSGELRCAVIITIMSTLLLVSFFSKFYTVDKVVLRAVGLPLQQLPCLPFGTLGTHKYSACSAAGSPACLTTSPLPEACDVLEQTPGRGSQGWTLWPESALGDVSRFGSMNPELRWPGGKARACIHVRD